MNRRFTALFSIIVAIVMALSLVQVLPGPAAAPASIQDQAAGAALPAGLLPAVLAASARPFEVTSAGFQTHAGGLDFALSQGGLQVSGDSLAWGIALAGLGRGKAIAALPEAAAVQGSDCLELVRGPVTEWYRSTALGTEQGFTIQQAPGGTGELVLTLNVSGGLAAAVDSDGRGVSFTPADGARVLRYDHLQARDAAGAALGARLEVVSGQVALAVDDRGALYPVTVDPLIYSEQKATTADGAANDAFGGSLALSNDTALVGVSSDDIGANADQGSAYVFTRSAGVWSLQARLTAADGAANDYFGGSVALSGDTALVAATGHAVGANASQGSAYVFTRSAGIWTQQALLTAADGTAYDYLGGSAALSGDTALVGTIEGDGSTINQGSAYVFTRSGTAWSQQAKLTAADGATNDHFSWSLALAGDTAVVGAPGDNIGASADQGSAYVFTRSAGVWSQQAQLTAGDGQAGDVFGNSVALSGDTALLGANGHNIGGNRALGSAYVFTRSAAVWSQQAELTASDGAAWDNFGTSLALFGDTALVAASVDDIGDNTNQGSAYVFTRSGTVWTQQAKLTAADGATNDYFGLSVALWGDTALLGSPFDDVSANNDQGSAYVFTGSGAAWTQQTQLTVNYAAASDFIGYSAAISGDTAVVGAPNDDIGANADQGAAYVFTRRAGFWSLQARLTAADGAAGDHFGYSVALSGDTALVGAYLDDVGASADQGSAYVFTRSAAGVWTQQARLIVTEATGTSLDHFGTSVALSGDTALVGAPYDDDTGGWDQGSAYIFTSSAGIWTEQARLIAADGAEYNYFGISVALSGDTALVGAHLNDIGSNAQQGSAYVFTRGAGVWTQQAKLTAADGGVSDNFGWSVALDGDTALVGAFLDDIGPNADQGSVYIFTRGGTAWTQQAQLTAADGQATDWFGYSMSLSGSVALIGANLDSAGPNLYQGSAYIFTRSGTYWSMRQKFVASDGAQADYFGMSVALDGNTALVGSPNTDIGANGDQGSAYFYQYFYPFYLPMTMK